MQPLYKPPGTICWPHAPTHNLPKRRHTLSPAERTLSSTTSTIANGLVVNVYDEFEPVWNFDLV